MDTIIFVVTKMDFQEDQTPPYRQGDDSIPDGLHADSLLLSLDGYEGPIDLLLTLARDQKVDLAKISILALTEQYLDFIDRAKNLRLEIAADYLVMAAWLAYLKSKLLVPQNDDEAEEEELSGEALAEALAFQLKRLEAMQKASDMLFALPQMGRDVFAKGKSNKDEADIQYTPIWQADLYDILSAYGSIARRQEAANYTPKTWDLMSTEDAYNRLSAMLGKLPRKDGVKSVWAVLDSFIPEDLKDALIKRSSRASIFTATLEMAKQGDIEIKQDGLFKPIYVRQTDKEHE
jgi:segregation and condensation protein A